MPGALPIGKSRRALRPFRPDTALPPPGDADDAEFLRLEDIMKKLSSTELYQYLMNEQAKIQEALEEEAEGPSAELRRGAWAMSQRIVERFELGPKGNELH